MRVLSCAAIAVCFASPVSAKVVTVDAQVNGLVLGDYKYRDAEYENCTTGVPGPFSTQDNGWFYGGTGISTDHRAVYEYDISGLKQINSARFAFTAHEQYHAPVNITCLAATAGDGLLTVADFDIGEDDLLDRFAINHDLADPEPSYFYGDYDVTSLIQALMRDGVDYIRFVFAIDNFADNDINLYDVSLSLDVPEPAALALFGLGLTGLSLRRRRPSA